MLVSLLLACGAPVLAQRAPPGVRVLLQEVPPFVYNRRGVPEGFMPDLLASLEAELGAGSMTVEFAPMPRAVELLRLHPNTAFAPIARVGANEHEFKWLGGLLRNRVFAYRLSSSAAMPADMDQLRAVKRIAVSSGGGHQALMEEAGFRNLLLVRSQVDAFRRVMAGEAEFCVISELVMRGILAEEKQPPEVMQSVGFVLSDSEVQLAFSPQVEAAVLARWRAALDRLRKTGRLESLAHQHFGPKAQVPPK